jgi:oligopeptide/dipeptide ABC transporter ATP-binding protein
MYAGRIVETAAVDSIFRNPGHHYTRALMDCMPSRNSGAHRLPTVPGQPPAPGTIMTGCVFASRCAAVRELCRVAAPPRSEISRAHDVLCAFPLHGGGPA